MKESRIFSLMVLPFSAQYLITIDVIETNRLIPIWIGMYEGSAIAMALQGEKPPRPMTHDLMLSFLINTGYSVLRVTITDLKENTYYAVITLEKDGETFEIDSRPSDAFALAVRAEAPIFVADQVLDICPVITKPISEDEIASFKSQLSNLSPDEFFKKLEE